MLAGGRSRRMGEDKRRLRLFPESPTFLERAVAIGRLVGDEVMVVASGDGGPSSSHVEWFPDVWPGEGPLGALVTAFRVVTSGRVVVLAIDYPMLQVGLLRKVTARGEGNDVVVAATEDDGQIRRHSLVGNYDAATCGPVASSLFAAGERSIDSLLRHLDVATVSFVSRIDSLALANVNTPEQLATLRTAVLERDHAPSRAPSEAVGSSDVNPYTRGSGPARPGGCL